MTCTTRACVSSPSPTGCRCHFSFGSRLTPAPVGPGDGPIVSMSSSDQDAPVPGIAVPVGGGKDSIVLVEALKAAEPAAPSSRSGWSRSTGAPPCSARRRSQDCRSLSITRTISPRLLELNSAGALNGHVPDHRDRVAHRRGRRVRLRLRHDPHGARALGGRGDVARRGTWRSTTSGARAPSASSACGRWSANRSHARSSTPLPCARAASSRSRGGSRTCPPTTPASEAAIRSSAPARRSMAGAASARSAGSCSWCWLRFSSLTGSRPYSVTTSSRTLGRSKASVTCSPAGANPMSASASNASRCSRSCSCSSIPSGATPRSWQPLRPELERSRSLVDADLESGVPVIESAEVDAPACRAVRRAAR